MTTTLILSVFILLVAVVLAAIGFLIFLAATVLAGDLAGAPFVASRKEKIATMIELADIMPGETAIDLGAGDGALLMETARGGAFAKGVEINPILWWRAKRRIQKSGFSRKAEIMRGNLFSFPIRDADVLFLYLSPRTLVALKERLIRELRPDARIVSNGFPIPGWQHEKEKNKVYLYRKP